MKKLIAKLLCFTCAAAVALPLAACGGDEPDVLHVYMPDGAPAIALASMMDGGYDGMDFTVVAAEEIAGLVSNGTADLAIMPIDGAARVYNKNNNIVMLSVNTHGNLYVVGHDEGEIGLSDLAGKRLGVIGQGSVPDNTLRMLCDEVDVEYQTSDTAVNGKISVTYGEARDLLPLFKSGTLDYALLGEPAATNSGGHIAIDMQRLWQTAFDSEFPQACLVAKRSVAENRKNEINKFIADLSDNDGWAKNDPDKALAAISGHMKAGTQTTLAKLTADIVERCNIKTVAAADAKASCEAYFAKLVTLNTGLPGNTAALGKAPDEGFYYQP